MKGALNRIELRRLPHFPTRSFRAFHELQVRFVSSEVPQISAVFWASKATSAAPGAATTDAAGDRDTNNTNFMQGSVFTDALMQRICAMMENHWHVVFRHCLSLWALNTPKLQSNIEAAHDPWLFALFLRLWYFHVFSTFRCSQIPTEESDMPRPGQAFA